MGRLADTWAGKKITQRIPYMMPGELTGILSATTGRPFPDGTFTHNVDMPFEVHRLKPWVTGLDGAGVAVITQPDQLLLLDMVKAQIDRIGGTIKWTKVATRLIQMVKGTAELTWELADPDTIVRQEGYQISVDVDTIPAFAVPISSLRIEIAFQGFLLQVAPPSEKR